MKKRVNITRDVESRRRIAQHSARRGAAPRAAEPAVKPQKDEREETVQEQLPAPEGETAATPARSKRPRGTSAGKP